jgi:ribosomal protein S18 acetylase RimI-like enzyme
LPDGTISDLTAENSIATLVGNRVADLWVAERSNHMEGALGADEAVYIWALYVHPDHQRQGIGTALLTHAEEHFRSIGLKNLFLDILETNEAAQKFYASNSWQEEGRRREELPVIPQQSCGIFARFDNVAPCRRIYQGRYDDRSHIQGKLL